MAGRTALVPLTDIRDAIRRIERYTAGKSLAAFRRDELVNDAVERCLEIISEASRRLSEEMKARHPDIPWRKVAGLGNVFRHEYDAVSTPLVWEIVREHLPPLKRAVSALIRNVRGKPNLESDKRFRDRIGRARRSLRAGRGVKLEDVK
jgi:uncharacterized protein with HEPN domain